GRISHGRRGGGIPRAARRRRGGDEAPHPQLRQAPAHLDAQAAGRPRDRRDRPRAGPGGPGDRGARVSDWTVRPVEAGDIPAMRAIRDEGFATYSDFAPGWRLPDDYV